MKRNPAASQAFEARGDLVEIAAHLLDLVVDRTALRRLPVEQREEARAVAAHPLGLRGHAVELALLARLRVLVAADLLVLGGVARTGAAVDGGKLDFKALADRISGCAGRRTGLWRTGLRGRCTRGRSAGGHLGKSIRRQRDCGRQHGAGKEPPGEGIGQRFQHIRPLNDFAGGPFSLIARPTQILPAAKAAFLAASGGIVTSFWRRRCGGWGGMPQENGVESALASDGDVLAAAAMATFDVGVLGNRAGDLVGVDAAVRGGLSKIA